MDPQPSFIQRSTAPKSCFSSSQVRLFLDIYNAVRGSYRPRVEKRIEHWRGAARMNEICGCGSRSLFRLSHARLTKVSKKETTRFGLSPRATKTLILGYRSFDKNILTMTGSQTRWTAPVVRKQFLDFFEAKGHAVGKWCGSYALKHFERDFQRT